MLLLLTAARLRGQKSRHTLPPHSAQDVHDQQERDGAANPDFIYLAAQAERHRLRCAGALNHRLGITARWKLMCPGSPVWYQPPLPLA